MSEVTDLMIEMASDAYMPFGDMKLALEVALIHAPSPWIPCSERMPNVGESVLGLTDCGIIECHYIGGDSWDQEVCVDAYNHDVDFSWPTHWMPLPLAPTN